MAAQAGPAAATSARVATASPAAITISVTQRGRGCATQVTNQVTVFGVLTAATAVDMAVILPSSVPVLVSPPDGATGVLPSPVLSWMSSFEAASYDVHFGTSSAPPLVANTTETSFVPGPLAAGVTYYWQVAAHGSFGSAASAVRSFTTAALAGLRFVPVTPCRLADTRGRTDAFGGPALPGGFVRSFAVPQGGCGIPATAQAYALNVTAVPRGRLSYLRCGLVARPSLWSPPSIPGRHRGCQRGHRARRRRRCGQRLCHRSDRRHPRYRRVLRFAGRAGFLRILFRDAVPDCRHEGAEP